MSCLEDDGDDHDNDDNDDAAAADDETDASVRHAASVGMASSCKPPPRSPEPGMHECGDTNQQQGPKQSRMGHQVAAQQNQFRSLQAESHAFDAEGAGASTS